MTRGYLYSKASLRNLRGVKNKPNLLSQPFYSELINCHSQPLPILNPHLPQSPLSHPRHNPSSRHPLQMSSLEIATQDSPSSIPASCTSHYAASSSRMIRPRSIEPYHT